MHICTGEPKRIAYYYTLSEIFVFRESDDTVTVEKIDPLYQKKTYTLVLPDSPETNCLSKRKIVRNYLKQGYIPTLNDKVITFLPPDSRYSADNCLQQVELFCDRSINRLRMLLLEKETNHHESLVCPITCDLFKEPVLDDDGHTFEKSAILDHLIRNSRTCPISREPIHRENLRPNLTVKGLADEARNRPFIPLLSAIHGKEVVEDRVRAELCIKTAKSFEDVGDYKVALEMYSQAYLNTNKSEDYEVIPLLFNKMKEPLKEALAYLCLAKRQIQEGKNAQHAIAAALELLPQEEALMAMQAFYFDFQGRTYSASAAFFKLACQLQQEGKEHLAYIEYAIALDPCNKAIYGSIHYKDDIKVCLFLIAFANFYSKDRATAMSFYRKACLLQPQNPLIYLALLGRLEKKDPEKITLYRRLVDIYSENGEIDSAFIYFNKVAVQEKDPQYIKRYINYLVANGQKEKGEELTLAFLDLLYPEDEVGINAAMALFGRKTPFLEHLLNIYLSNHNESVGEVIPELAAHYEREGKLGAVEKIYRIAHERLRHFESSFKYAQILAEEGKKEESSRVYYELSSHAYKNRQLDKVAMCLHELGRREMFSLFSTQEEQILLTQNYTVEMFQTINRNHEELKVLQQQQVETSQKFHQQLEEGQKQVLQEIKSCVQELFGQIEKNKVELKTSQEEHYRSYQRQADLNKQTQDKQALDAKNSADELLQAVGNLKTAQDQQYINDQQQSILNKYKQELQALDAKKSADELLQAVGNLKTAQDQHYKNDQTQSFLNKHKQDQQALDTKNSTNEILQAVGKLKTAYEEEKALQQETLNTIRAEVKTLQKQFDPQERGIALNSVGRSTALIEAAGNGDIEAVKSHLMNEVDVNRIDHNGNTALICAIQNEALEIVRLLIQNGAEIENFSNTKNDKVILATANSALWFAVDKGNVKIIELLIKYKAKVGCGSKNTTVLSYAVRKGFLEVVSLLLKNGAYVSDCRLYLNEKDDRHALSYAAEGGHAKILELLLEYAGKHDNLDFGNKHDCLHYAVKSGSIDAVRCLCKYLEIKALEKKSRSRFEIKDLILAAKMGEIQIMEILIEYGQKTKGLYERDLQDVLNAAAKSGSLEAVRVLFKYGAKVNEDVSSDKATKYTVTNSLILAAGEGHVSIVELLIERQANVNDALAWLKSGNCQLFGSGDVMGFSNALFGLKVDEAKDSKAIELLKAKESKAIEILTKYAKKSWY